MPSGADTVEREARREPIGELAARCARERQLTPSIGRDVHAAVSGLFDIGPSQPFRIVLRLDQRPHTRRELSAIREGVPCRMPWEERG